MHSPIVAEFVVLLERATLVLSIRISGLVLCPPLLHVIHCCPFCPVACCTSVRTECSGRREVGVYRKGTGLPVWRPMVYGMLCSINCDGSRLCFQVSKKTRSWFVVVPYSKVEDLYITHFHSLSANNIYIITCHIRQCKQQKQVFQVKKLVGLPPQLELLACFHYAW